MHLPKRYDLTESHIHIVPGSLHQGVQVDNKKIASTYTFSETRVNIDEASGKVSVWPESTILHFEVDRTVPRVGYLT